MEMCTFKLVFKIIRIFLALMFLTSNVQASIIELSCIMEEGPNKKIIINEKSKKILHSMGPGANYKWDYRNLSINIYVHEIVNFKSKTIWRFILDLDKMLDEMVVVHITEKEVKQIKIARAKYDRGEIAYDKINQMKKQIFDKLFIKPEDYKGIVKKQWRGGPNSHPDEYVLMKKASDDFAVQMSMIHRCEFVN